MRELLGFDHWGGKHIENNRDRSTGFETIYERQRGVLRILRIPCNVLHYLIGLYEEDLMDLICSHRQLDGAVKAHIDIIGTLVLSIEVLIL